MFDNKNGVIYFLNERNKKRDCNENFAFLIKAEAKFPHDF